MEVKIINAQSNFKYGLIACEQTIKNALKAGGVIEEDGLTVTLTGSRYLITGKTKMNGEEYQIHESGMFCTKVWMVWAFTPTGQESLAFQPIATFDTLSEACQAATQDEIHPKCHIKKWDGLAFTTISPSKADGGFFVQESWI